ncbi:PREDICTED: T-cell activation Rho GTPase-activating protein isoform X4 [Calidris pugnax]|uniref:T-cell activation Rho GTPase-activating protein isoform X3 n=1 Tax=Calidris pugnax TaxID=198806 RepID=UPI00071C42F2|nr:PREDICTED: T-cell activation Rho GTPase-activating protein isoform X3 [Calidris pugnax]XP_014795029.1 PREDICTED: T-cell activation Rho GTPase-activating protein isoform X4 [Calidris pugnax]
MPGRRGGGTGRRGSGGGGGGGVPASQAPLKTVPPRRCSAPSLLFSKGLSKPWLPSTSSREVKELWLDSFLGQTKGPKETRVSRAPPIKLLMKVLSSCNTSKTLNAGNMESLIECQSEADAKKCPPLVPAETEDGLCHPADGTKKRKKVISQSFTLRRSSTNGNSPGQLDPGAKITLFGQPLAIVCGEDDTLPQPVQDLLAILYMKGPSTEGIFRKAANEKARKELKEDLNKGENVDLKSKSVHLLAVVLKDFLRNIPSKLLSADLYEKWMQALEKPSKQEKIEELKEVADKLPRPNLVLLKHLLSLLHHISQNAETTRMDSSNLAICVGPNMLSPETDNTLPLEVQKEMNDKVTVLVEFLINNCSEIFGEDLALPACASAEESPEHTDSSTEHLCAAHQNDSAYDSPDPEAEGSPCASQMEQPKGRSSSVSRRYPTCISAPSLTNFRNDISTMDRRYSEPDLSFQNRLEGRIRKEKLNKSEDNFPVQQKQLGLEALERRLAVLPSQLSTDSLPKTSSSCSLESSDGSVFTSSPVVSPSSPKKTFLNRPQSFSTKATEDCSTASREIKKHSMSFSFANRRKTLIKTQSWGPGKNFFFQRDSFTKKEDHFSCRVVQEISPDDDKPLPVAHQQRPRFRSADEVFREVDQRNPGRPPSYEEATKNCLATEVLSHNLTVQTMRLKASNQDALPPHPCSSLVQDAACTALRDLPGGRVSAMKDSDLENETLSVTVGINSRVSLPVTPGVYRLRAMSESCQKNKLEYVARRCSQPVFEVDQIQYAKESYV